jgi:hypothetical protein
MVAAVACTHTCPLQARDVVVVAAVRTGCALFCSANALALLPLAFPAAAADVSISSGAVVLPEQLGLLSVLAAAVVLLSPLPPAGLEFTRSFRLNETLGSACRDASLLAAGPLLLLLAGAIAGLGLLPPGLPPPGGAAACTAATVDVAAAGDATALAAGKLALAAAIAVGAGAVWERLSPDKGRMLKFAGAPGAASVGAAGAGAPAEAATGIGQSDEQPPSPPQGGSGSSTAASALPWCRPGSLSASSSCSRGSSPLGLSGPLRRRQRGRVLSSRPVVSVCSRRASCSAVACSRQPQLRWL